jgi:hypothetical protein
MHCNRVERPHDGRIAGDQSDTRWCPAPAVQCTTSIVQLPNLNALICANEMPVVSRIAGRQFDLTLK